MGSRRKTKRRAEKPSGQPMTAWWLVLLVSIFPFVFRQVSVSDAWWHVAIGKWLVNERSLPDLAKFYFSPFDANPLIGELRWEWLGDVIFYFFHATMGAVGLQLLVIVCVLGGLGFLAAMTSGKPGPWTLLLLVAVCFGTYQLQLARNSVFSLVLYPAILWLGTRRSGPPSLKEYAAVGALLLFWSCLHGSCVLGWVTALVLYGSRALGAFRGRPASEVKTARAFPDLRSSGLPLVRFCVAFGGILILLTAGRPGALEFVYLPAKHVAETAAPKVQDADAALAPAASKSSGGLKEWLNSSIWKPDPGTPWSNDYWSPFDMLPGMHPIEVAFGLAILAACCALWLRNIPLGLFLAWCGAVFLGAGYVRMFGYTALASGAVILRSVGDRRCAPWLAKLGWPVVGVWICLSWWAMLGGRMEALIPDGQYVAGFGQVPIYDSATADWVKKEFPNEKVFTTIETGSFCLLRWDFQKQVFIDGFFAPHPRDVWDNYHAALDDLSILHDRYGITLAIVPTTSGPWLTRFRQSRGWNPIAIGEGTVVYAHESLSLDGKQPEIFFTAEDLRATSFYFRKAVLQELFLIASGTEGGKGRHAPEQWAQHPSFDGFRELAKDVFPSR